MTNSKVSPEEFIEQHTADLSSNNVPNLVLEIDSEFSQENTIHQTVQNNGEFQVSQRTRRDFRSSVGNISISKATERITYCWDNINIWTTGISPEKVKEGSANEKFNKFKFWKNTRKSKHILKDVKGVAKPGQLMCIMGASGAGKTTLLNALTFRIDKKNLKVISGTRTVNGVPINPKALTSISSFVQQDDLFIGSLTVREHLTFQALLKMHPHIPYAERIQRVDDVMNELGLTKCAETQIGYPGRIKGISGGEMKRLSFASEVLTDPPLMFCDEPTSGLDSFMAQNVVTVLKELVTRKKKTIICTIHQPSSQVYSLFDKILLMAEGRVAYIGDTKDLPDFMKENGYPIPFNFNPSDFVIETLAIRPGFENESREIVTQICDAFDTSKQGEELNNILANSHNPDPEAANYLKTEADIIRRSPYKANWITQFRTVFWRSWISYIKDPFIINLQIFQTLAVGLVVGFIYYGQLHNQEGIMNITGAMFLILTQVTIQNIFGVLDAFILELPIFLREHFNGMYRTEVYFLTKILAELPFALTWPVLFTSICYFMIGLYPDREAFLHTILIITLIALVSNSFGYLISCFSKSIVMALAVAPPFMLPLMLFGGFFLHNDSIPYAMRWIKYFSWFYYGNEALSIVQWEKVESIDCNIQPFTCPSDGKLILLVWGYKVENYQTDIIALVLLVIGYRVLAFLALLVRTMRYS